MSLAAKYLPNYTYDDYKIWKGDWELIDGLPFAISPSPIKKHQKILFKLARIFDDALINCNECEVIGELDWVIDNRTIVKPDLFVNCEKTNDDFLRNTPNLVVEILSPSTAHKDRNLKFELYEKQGVKYYLIVDPINESIEIFQLTSKVYKKQIELNEGTFDFDFEKCTTKVDFKNTWK